ncbi:MAG: flagellar biosynthetic protein FliR, partial [Armatimonadetes bacterium]|nr:flagellar biosynthetic protein FliR [Armatimonadota bacterium]
QITAFVLVLARVGGIFTSAPVFGNVHVAPRVRIAVALALTFVFLPLAKYPEPRLDFLPFAFAVLKEALIGIAMGFVVSLVFAAIQMAGSYIDLLVGFGFADIVDPMVREHNAVVSQLQNLAATLLFLAVNGHHLVIRGLADSFSVIPLGVAEFSPNAAGGMMRVFVVIFAAALKIAAPVVGAIFLTDVSLGILARTVPQLNVFVVGFPAKLAVALFAVIAVMPLAFGVMADLFTGLHRDLLALLRHLVI